MQRGTGKTEQMPELLEVVAGNLVSVEEGLAALDAHKTVLHKHALNVKQEISEAVDRHLTQLRAREKHLLRQIELATTGQNSEVNMTQAQLLQHKGALSVTRTILDNCNSPSFSCPEQQQRGSYGRNTSCTVRSSIATTVNSLPHQDVASLLQHTEKLVKVPLVSVQVDENSLRGSIQNFGKVSLPPPTLPHSELLPHSLEEYGDVEHHVLHKSVRPEIASPPPIDVRKPYILAAKNLPSRRMVAPFSPKKVSDSKKEELVKWLHRLQLDSFNDCTMEEGCCGDSVCVEEVCQANESCNSFSQCLMSGQCKKNAEEKLQQTNMWRLKQSNAPAAGGRKRHCSAGQSTEPARSVVAHMMNILGSDNGEWLINDSSSRCSSAMEVESHKKMKVSHVAQLSAAHEDICSAILYRAPANTTWTIGEGRASTPAMAPAPAVDEMEDAHDVQRVDDNIKSWLLSSSPLSLITGSNLKKANCEKENSLCRASLLKTKSQMSLHSFDSIENEKEGVDEKMSMNIKRDLFPTSDIEEKQQWLLKQESAFKADNKILEEVLKKKEEWLSNSSMSSFSILSENDSVINNNWLLSQ